MAKTDGLGIASLVLSIFGLLGFWTYGGIILSTLAILLAIKQRKIKSNNTATAGLVIGIVGLVLSVSWLIFGIYAKSFYNF